MTTAYSSALDQEPTRNAAGPSSWYPSNDHAQHADEHLDDSDDSPPTSNGHAANGHTFRLHHLPPRSSSLRAPGVNTSPGAHDRLRSPFNIGLHAALLTTILTSSLSALVYLRIAHPATGLWRLPFFSYLLAQFHLLEFFSTAYSNPSAATTSAFLLDNGKEYNIAHLLAFTECLLHWTFYPDLFSSLSFFSNDTRQPSHAQTPLAFTITTLLLGVPLLLTGQLARSLAMLTAGPNFTHLVAATKLPHHKLVTHGIYSLLRHPAYFGFFWWGIGSQLVLGNIFCLFGYAIVLWRFFRRRITKEESLLVGFFGEEYEVYRRGRARVGIPGIG